MPAFDRSWTEFSVVSRFRPWRAGTPPLVGSTRIFPLLRLLQKSPVLALPVAQPAVMPSLFLATVEFVGMPLRAMRAPMAAAMFLWRQQFQVCQIGTEAVLAAVMDVRAARDRSPECLVNQNVEADLSPLEHDPAVTSTIVSAGPFQTPRLPDCQPTEDARNCVFHTS